MKNLKTPCTVLALALTSLVACRKADKNELIPASAAETTEVTTAVDSTQSDVVSSEWERTADWSELKQATYTIYTTHLKANISSANADNALVRVFSQAGEKGMAKSLPFEETVNGTKYYWYYTVTEGDVMLAVDVYGEAKNPGAGNLFKYVIFDEKAISNLEAAGTSKADLVDLPLEKLTRK